ncbi:MAG: AAA family ATPase [Nitrospinota bacterium]
MSPNKKKSGSKLPTTVIALSSSSGGVGNSTIALNMATLLASLGKKTLLVDFSFNGSSRIDLIKQDEVANSLKDLFSKSFLPIKKIIGKSNIPNLSYLNNGFDYLDFSDKKYKLRRNLIKQLATTGNRYIVLDLGTISDKTRLDYFLDSKIRLLLTSPTLLPNSILSFTENLFIRKLTNSRKAMSKDLKRIAKNFSTRDYDKDPDSLFNAIAKGTKSKVESINKLEAIASNQPLYHLLINKQLSKDEDTLYEKLILQIEERSDLKIANAGVVFFDKDLSNQSELLQLPIADHGRSLFQESLKKVVADLTNESLDIDEKLLAEIRLTLSKNLLSTMGKRQLEVEQYYQESKKEIKNQLDEFKREKLEEVEKSISTRRAILLEQLATDATLEQEKQRSIKTVKMLEELEKVRSTTIEKVKESIKEEELTFRKELLERIQNEQKLNSAALKDQLDNELREKQSEMNKRLQLLEEEKRSKLDIKIKSLEAAKLRETEAKHVTEAKKIHDLIWSELEADRENRINLINDELDRMRVREMDILSAEVERRRVYLIRRAENLARKRQESLLASSYEDIMTASAHYDTESYRKRQEFDQKLQDIYRREFEKQQERVNQAIKQYKNSLMTTIENELQIAKKARIRIIEKEIVDWRITKNEEVKNRLLFETRKKRDDINRTLSKKAKEAWANILLERKKSFADLEEEISVERDKRLDIIQNNLNQYETDQRRKIASKLQLEKKRTIRIIESDLVKIKNNKILLLTDELEKIRETKLEKMEQSVAKDIELDRKRKLVEVENELQRKRATLFLRLNDEIQEQRRLMLKDVEASLVQEQRRMRSELSHRMFQEENRLKEELTEKMEQQHQESVKVLNGELEPLRLLLEADMRKDIGLKRQTFYRNLQIELNEVRSKEAKKVHALLQERVDNYFEAAKNRIDIEKDRRIALLESHLKRMKEDSIIDITIDNEFQRHTLDKKNRELANSTLDRLLTRVDKEASEYQLQLKDMLAKEVQMKKASKLEILNEELRKEEEKRVSEFMAELEQYKSAELEKLERHIANEKNEHLEHLEHQAALNEKVMLIRLNKRKEDLLAKHLGWVEFEVENHKVKLQAKMNNKLADDYSMKLNKIEIQLQSEKERLLSRVQAEVQLDKRLLTRKLESENRLDLMQKNADRSLEDMKLVKGQKIQDELAQEKRTRLKIIENELSLERAKRLEIIEIDLKTEEYKRRQEMIIDIMNKKNSLERALAQEKSKFYDQMRDEILKNAHLSKERFEEEIRRLARNVKLN